MNSLTDSVELGQENIEKVSGRPILDLLFDWYTAILLTKPAPQHGAEVQLPACGVGPGHQVVDRQGRAPRCGPLRSESDESQHAADRADHHRGRGDAMSPTVLASGLPAALPSLDTTTPFGCRDVFAHARAIASAPGTVRMLHTGQLPCAYASCGTSRALTPRDRPQRAQSLEGFAARSTRDQRVMVAEGATVQVVVQPTRGCSAY